MWSVFAGRISFGATFLCMSWKQIPRRGPSCRTSKTSGKPLCAVEIFSSKCKIYSPQIFRLCRKGSLIATETPNMDWLYVVTEVSAQAILVFAMGVQYVSPFAPSHTP